MTLALISNIANYLKYNYFLDCDGIDNVTLRLWKFSDFCSRHTVGVAGDDIMFHILVCIILLEINCEFLHEFFSQLSMFMMCLTSGTNQNSQTEIFKLSSFKFIRCLTNVTLSNDNLIVIYISQILNLGYIYICCRHIVVIYVDLQCCKRSCQSCSLISWIINMK